MQKWWWVTIGKTRRCRFMTAADTAEQALKQTAQGNRDATVVEASWGSLIKAIGCQKYFRDKISDQAVGSLPFGDIDNRVYLWIGV